MGPSSSINLAQYVSFQITPGVTIQYVSLSYSKQSFLGQGPRNAAVRTSLDGYATNVDSVSGLNPADFDQIVFNLGSLPPTSAPIEFRIYFFNTPSTGADWADLLSSNRGGTGLILTANHLAVVPTLSPSALLALVVLLALIGAWGARHRPQLR